jgi:WhiB family transcriptional regulator, redox-sensing transcriptional regulator
MDTPLAYRQPPVPMRRFAGPTPVAGEWDWQRHGSCRGLSSELFFPDDDDSRERRRHREKQAKSICHDCPVLVECRNHAMRTPEKYGVWGAMSARERARLRARLGERVSVRELR